MSWMGDCLSSRVIPATYAAGMVTRMAADSRGFSIVVKNTSDRRGGHSNNIGGLTRHLNQSANILRR